MPRTRPETVSYEVIELGGVRYAVVRESLLMNLCRWASVAPAGPRDHRMEARPDLQEMEHLDGATLAGRLVARRKGLGISQTAMAQRAGIRVETLNRIERGKVTPDFATIRKLVVALREAEAEIEA